MEGKKFGGKNAKIGFVGLGFVGGNLADSLEDRGFENLVRYSLEPKYRKNRGMISKCDMVFICVPTPTKKGKFDGSVVVEGLSLVGEGAIAVIRSTVPPGFIYRVMNDVGCRIVYSPEFLDEDTARKDTDSPARNVVGVHHPNTEEGKDLAACVLSVIPRAKRNVVCSYDEASLIKYAGNGFFFVKNVFFNAVADIADSIGCDSELIRSAVASDSRIGEVHTHPVHKGGRGAGGKCLPKDMRVMREFCQDILGQYDPAGSFLFHAERRNRKMLESSGKDSKIVKEVY